MESFALAAHAFVGLVEQIPPTAWAGPGLGVWDLRSLVGHTSRSLITVDTYLDRPAQTETVASSEDYFRAARTMAAADQSAVAERGRQAGEALGADPAGFVRELVARVLPRAAAAGDPVIETIVGGMRLSVYLPTRTFELVVHSLDIARAAALAPPEFPRPVLIDVVTMAARSAVADGRGAELLLALTGRETLPAGFSVV